jgi:TPR repeat protein
MLKQKGSFCYTADRFKLFISFALSRARPSKFARWRGVVMGAVTGLAISATAALASDTQAIRACDAAAASPTDPMRPAGIAGVTLNDIDAKTALAACEAALAAHPDNPRLMWELGRVFGAMGNSQKSHALYENAAAKGYADAEWAVGVLYSNGQGMPKDIREAVRWERLAADQGHAMARTFMGLAYLDGIGGLPQSNGEAVRYLKLAADQGDADGQYNLGTLYEEGRGVEQDERMAIYWYQKAAAQGQADAKAAVDKLERLAQRDAKPAQAKVPDAIVFRCELFAVTKTPGSITKGDPKVFERWKQLCIRQALNGIDCAGHERSYPAQCGGTAIK